MSRRRSPAHDCCSCARGGRHPGPRCPSARALMVPWQAGGGPGLVSAPYQCARFSRPPGSLGAGFCAGFPQTAVWGLCPHAPPFQSRPPACVCIYLCHLPYQGRPWTAGDRASSSLPHLQSQGFVTADDRVIWRPWEARSSPSSFSNQWIWPHQDLTSSKAPKLIHAGSSVASGR